MRVAVLVLARSVCAFSAASGGADKYRGGAICVLADVPKAELQARSSREEKCARAPWSGSVRSGVCAAGDSATASFGFPPAS